MLRVDNGSVLEYSANINYASTGKKCYQGTKSSCIDHGKTNVEILNDLHRQNACATFSCKPLKKCMAKTGMHDSAGNFLTKEMIGMNVKANMNVGGNQIGYVYQEKSLLTAFEASSVATPATLLAKRNSELYGKDTNWDGTHSGFFCVSCPPKTKPCPPASKCKKADPFNAPIGLGSDVNESRQNLRDDFNGRVFQNRVAPSTADDQTDLTFNLSDLPVMKDSASQATGKVVFNPSQAVRGATSRGKARVVEAVGAVGVGVGMGHEQNYL
jgi:hypothetical protein